MCTHLFAETNILSPLCALATTEFLFKVEHPHGFDELLVDFWIVIAILRDLDAAALAVVHTPEPRC